MLTAARTITFTVTADSMEPATPQWAGVQGEHQATAVIFNLPAEWVEKGCRFRAEWVDGMQAFYTSDWLPVTDNTVTCLLPQAWTAAGGIGEIRLAAILEGESTALSQTIYTTTGRLTFISRDGGL